MYTPLSKTRLSSSTCVGCPLASQVSVRIRSPGSRFSQRKVGISFAEVNGKQRESTSWETHICLFCQGRSLWFAVWEISSVAALCDTYSPPTPRLLCVQSCADPLSSAAFPRRLLHGATSRAHCLVEDLFSAELGGHWCLLQSWALQGLLIGSPCWSRLILEDCSLWEPMSFSI